MLFVNIAESEVVYEVDRSLSCTGHGKLPPSMVPVAHWNRHGGLALSFQWQEQSAIRRAMAPTVTDLNPSAPSCAKREALPPRTTRSSRLPVVA
jgi:hypothetical protein